MPTVSRPGIALQSPEAAQCHHAREPFDTGFRCINERRDISPTAKLVYHRLVSQHRMLARGQGQPLTQTEIGEDIGCSRHQVWRALGELVAYALVTVKRHGQGKPSTYILHGIDAENLDGKASRTGRSLDARPSGNTTRYPSFKNPSKKIGTYQRPYERLAYSQNNPSAYLQTREGTLMRR